MSSSYCLLLCRIMVTVASQGKESLFESGTFNFEIAQIGSILEEGGQDCLWLLCVDFKFLVHQPYRLYLGDCLEILNAQIGSMETDMLAANVSLDFVRRAIDDNFSLVDDDDAFRQRISLFQIVRGQENGFAARNLDVDLVPEVASRLHVKAGRGFVQEEDIGVANQRQGEIDALFLPTGEPTQARISLLLQPCYFNCLLSNHRAIVKAPKKLDQFADLERFWHAGFLKHDADALAVVSESGVLTKEHNTAAAGSAHAKHQRDRSGFAGAIGAENCHHFALLNRETDAFEGLDTAIVLGDMV